MQQFKQVVVDNRTSLKEIASDINRGLMCLDHVAHLLLLVGRADVLNGDCVPVVLERFLEAVWSRNYLGKITLVGPLPVAHDKLWLIEEMQQAWQDSEVFAKQHKNVQFCNVASKFVNQHGVIHALFDDNGLTLDGIREFNSALFF